MCEIKQPLGKFESETCVTVLMHYWAGNGCLDYIDNTDDEPVTLSAKAPFSLAEIIDAKADGIEICLECQEEILKAEQIQYWEDSNGFAYSVME